MKSNCSGWCRVAETKPLFELGQVVATPGAIDALARTDEHAAKYLARHLSGDWGDLGDEDKALNDRSVANPKDRHGFCTGRIFSAYRLSDGTKIWVITEDDRSATTILLPEEY